VAPARKTKGGAGAAHYRAWLAVDEEQSPGNRVFPEEQVIACVGDGGGKRGRRRDELNELKESGAIAGGNE
jgi:hypothetical protein